MLKSICKTTYWPNYATSDHQNAKKIKATFTI